MLAVNSDEVAGALRGLKIANCAVIAGKALRFVSDAAAGIDSTERIGWVCSCAATDPVKAMKAKPAKMMRIKSPPVGSRIILDFADELCQPA
ncbi:MAG: hypothetical protein IPG56_06400 [Caulobacteraceae bacterium]|nr:hypothetical protein [Caulobacteraceae bacterium]